MTKIIHIDMDAFYAAAELGRNPELGNKPVIIGGQPDSRGVVASCSYEARELGIHAAMPSSRAYRLCPSAIFLAPDIAYYQEISKKIINIFTKYSEFVEAVSLDEAYIDVSSDPRTASSIARSIKQQVYRETNLTASAGVSYNKFIAKLASDYRKPDGLTVVPPDKALEFLLPLDIEKFHGVGRNLAKKLRSLGILTGADLIKFRIEDLSLHLGSQRAFFLYNVVRGIDNRVVEARSGLKSSSRERTFSRDIADFNLLLKELDKLSASLSSYVIKKSLVGRSLSIKLRYSDFRVKSKTISLSLGINTKDKMLYWGSKLLKEIYAASEPAKFRLLGIRIAKLERADKEEQLLF